MPYKLNVLPVEKLVAPAIVRTMEVMAEVLLQRFTETSAVVSAEELLPSNVL